MKRLISLLLVLAVVTIWYAPRANSQSLVDRIEAVCTQLDARRQAIDTRLSEQAGRLNQSSQAMLTKLETRNRTANSKIEGIRTEAKAQRFEAYRRLRERAVNESQILAVEVFVSSMEKTVNERQLAYDRAISAFNSAVKNRLQEDVRTIETSTSDFRTKLESTFTSTEASCKSGQRLTDVRQQFVSNLREARLGFSSGASRLSHKNISEYVTQKNEALKEARANFESTVQGLQRALNSQLGD